MKILWVKAGGLFPLNQGGRIRSYNILRELARRHEITLFTFCKAQPDDLHHQLEPMFSRVISLALRLPEARGFGEGLLYLRNLFSLEPYSIRKYCRSEISERLRSLLEGESQDIIVCDFVFAAGVIPWEWRCPKVLFAHNVEALIWMRHYRLARNPLWKVAGWREWRLMERAERFYLRKADHVLAVSEAERDYFARFVTASKVTVIPTGVDTDHFRPHAERERGASLVFTGSMDWMPNEDAVLYFAREILPRVRRDYPQVTFWVVGRNPSAKLLALADQDTGIRVTGPVDDIRPYVQAASVFIVPLRIGGGTRLKIFEAMAMGKAVVSTSVGAEGLPVRSGENILLADNAEEFARAITWLLGNAAERQALGKAARELVDRNHHWKLAAARFEQVLEGMVARQASEGLRLDAD